MSDTTRDGSLPELRQRSKPAQPLHVAELADALLRLATVSAITGLGKTSIYSKVADGSFPEPIRQGARCTRWRAGDVQAWLQQQARRGAV